MRTGAVFAAGAASALAGSSVLRAARGLRRSMGARVDTVYTNTDPDSPHERFDAGKIVRGVVGRARHGQGRPSRPIPLVAHPSPEQSSDLAVTWYGHSSVLIEVDGFRVLADPVWGERVSPSPTIGPTRLHPVPVALSSLPPIDAVIISHDHYDHLDLPTIDELTRDRDVPFCVPIGVGGHLRAWGVPEDRIVELDWDQAHVLRSTGPDGPSELKVVCTEARHFSGRGLTRNSTQWASWSLVGPSHAVFFGGDTGFTERFKLVGDHFGPFDLTLLPIGAYDPLWPDVHTNPEEAVEIHRMIAKPGAPLVPVHWATFNLAFHDWSEPVERLLAAAEEAGVTTVIPMPGGRVDSRDERGGTGRADDWWAGLG
ncbi:MBL fold metallo-hydrolase [Tsukamurella sp. 1534]|uniref:MBL fold metallo-hydrolase n=1 Tax=Tsukamurella sp. 1534 TaxID=1151061 RepID=UPI000687684B